MHGQQNVKIYINSLSAVTPNLLSKPKALFEMFRC